MADQQYWDLRTPNLRQFLCLSIVKGAGENTVFRYYCPCTESMIEQLDRQLEEAKIVPDFPKPFAEQKLMRLNEMMKCQ